MKASSSILVCGGAGYIGSHVVHALLDAGESVVVVDDLSMGHAASVGGEIPVIRGSVGDRQCLDEVFSHFPIRAVMHLCASSLVGESVEKPLKYYRNNVANGLVLLEAMLDHGVGQIVFSSTAAVYGCPESVPITEDHRTQPINPYGRSKLTFEKMLEDFGQAYGLHSVSLRYFNAAGAALDGSIGEDHRPETHLIPVVLKAALTTESPELREVYPAQVKIFGSDYPTDDGTCVRDYIHVLDLAGAHLLALDYLRAGRDSAVVNLGNGSGFSVKQVVDVCRDVTGIDIEVQKAERRPGDPAVLVSDPARARDQLGWQTEYSELEQIIASAWKFHQRFPRGYPESSA